MNDENDPVQDAIKILRDRMEQYPDEFSPQTAKGWTRFWKTTEQIYESMKAHQFGGDEEYRNPLWFLTPEERATLYEGLRIAARQTFTSDVMSALTANSAPTPAAIHEELKQKLAYDAQQTLQRQYFEAQKMQPLTQGYLQQTLTGIGAQQQEQPKIAKPPAGSLSSLANKVRWAT